MATGERGSSAGSAAGGGGGGGKAAAAAADTEKCSVCLESVGGRSMTKLQCGHEFHLDCIGSAFNAKGVMQCPNCRQIEEGNWVNATGSSTSQSAYVSLSDYIFEEWTDDEALDLNNPEMPDEFSGFQWCPFDRLPQQFGQEGESSRLRTYQDPFDSPPRPNASYHQQLQAPFSSNPRPPSESIPHAFHRPWSHTSGSTSMPSMGSFYSGWDPYYHSSSSATRTARLGSDVLPRARHGFSSRTGSSFAPYIDLNVDPSRQSRGSRNHQNPPAPTMDLQPPGGPSGPVRLIYWFPNRRGPEAIEASNSGGRRTAEGPAGSPRSPRMHRFI